MQAALAALVGGRDEMGIAGGDNDSDRGYFDAQDTPAERDDDADEEKPDDEDKMDADEPKTGDDEPEDDDEPKEAEDEPDPADEPKEAEVEPKDDNNDDKMDADEPMEDGGNEDEDKADPGDDDEPSPEPESEAESEAEPEPEPKAKAKAKSKARPDVLPKGLGMGKKSLGKRHASRAIAARKGITKPSTRRLARRAGIGRIAGDLHETVRTRYFAFLDTILGKALMFTQHARRKTVTASDIVEALRTEGLMLYGYQK